MASLATLLHRARALVLRDRFHGALEEPRPGAAVADAIVISGWAFSTSAPIDRIEASVGGALLGAAHYGVARPDVARVFPELHDARCGYHLRAWLDASMNGPQSIDIRVVDRHGNARTYRRRVDVRPAFASRAAAAPLRQSIEDVLPAQAVSLRRPLAILDWHGKLASFDAGTHHVFAPAILHGDAGLPYATDTFDVVATGIGDRAHIDEATRVATQAVLVVDSTNGSRVETAWSAPADSRPATKVSIVIPVYGQSRHTNACLKQLLTTLPADLDSEIVVVDDASPDDTASVLARWAAMDPRIRIVGNDRNVGFGESCNRGARAASGDVIVFLNNDTLPRRGWLAPLVESLRDPKVGAVGSKLVYPDGTLQEAGGVIFSDASGWNFGHGDPNPDAPLFNHVRDVDYCSGAALATRRSLFLDIGGFDARFAPAYYEDTDYCFSLRANGYRVLYQPASVVVHEGGGTGGVSEQVGAKSRQTAHRVVFADKWRAALAMQPAPFDRVTPAALQRVAVRDRHARRALVCAPRPPEFDRESGSKRVYDTICFLRDAGWAVTFVAESAAGGERYLEYLRQNGVAVHSGSPDLVEHGRFDLAILHFWWIAERYLPLVRKHSPSTTVLVDSVDLHFVRHARMRFRAHDTGDALLDARYADEATRELNAYAAADGVLTVSQKEADTLNGLFGSSLAQAVPDAEDLRLSPIDFRERRGLLFLGNFRHTPNLEALEFLTREIVPRLPACLLAQHPLSIVGNALTPEIIEKYATPRHGIRFIGWVPSVEPYLERARLTLLPLLHGAGTKRKLIQAAMVGTPSVSTTIGVEGLPLGDGEEVLVADDPSAFADQIVRLVDDEALWNRLAQAGRHAVIATHGRGVVRAQFADVVGVSGRREADRGTSR